MKTAFSIAIILACLVYPAHAYNNQPETYQVKPATGHYAPAYRKHHKIHYVRRHKRGKRYHHAVRRSPQQISQRRPHLRYSTSLSGQPAPLVAKVQELISACGARVISGYRHGARVAGSGRISNHALNMADDIVGPPRCLYAHLRGWPGGYSVDYARVRHLHLSYNRGKEWGARFVHGGGTHRYARRHLRYARR